PRRRWTIPPPRSPCSACRSWPSAAEARLAARTRSARRRLAPPPPAGQGWGGATRREARGSGLELLAEDALFEVVLGIEQHGDRALARLADRHLDHVAHLVGVGGGADRALVGIEHAEAHLGIGPEQGPAPAAGAEGRDRGKRDHVRAQWQDRAV